MAPQIDRRQFLLGASSVAALAGLTACGADGGSADSGSSNDGSTASKKDATYAQSVQITSLDPAGEQPQVYPAGYEAAFAIFAGLVRFAPDLSFQPDLATEWTTSDDGLTWTFTLREGVTFHDGTPFDADAVVAHFTTMLDDTRNLGSFSLWAPISSVNKTDAQTVTVITTDPYGALLNTMAHGSALIPSPDSVKEYGKDVGLHPVGAGPYKVKEFKPGSSLVVEAFDDHYDGAPMYKTITYRYVADAAGRTAALQAGQADVIDAVPVEQVQGLETQPNVKLVEVTGLQVFGIGLNHSTPALQDKTVRQALNYAIDKEALIDSVFRGHATALDSPLAPDTIGYVEGGSYDVAVDEAKHMLADAGYTAGSDGILANGNTKLAFSLRTPDGLYPGDTKVAQVIQDQLKKVGVQVTVDKIDKAEFWDSIKVPQNKVDFDLVLFGYNPSHGSGTIQLDVMYRTNPAPKDSPPQWNFNWYSNPQVDQTITKAQQTVDPDEMTSTLGEAQKMIWDDCPYIWLYVSNNLSAYSTKVAEPLVLPSVFTLPSHPSS